VRDGSDPDVRPRFVELDAPTDDEVAALLDRIIARIGKLLGRRGYLDDGAVDHEPEPLLLLAAQPARRHTESRFDGPLPRKCARKDGFSLHAGIAVHANDRQGLERLARYGLRPALALERLTEAPDGTLRYQMKQRLSDGRHVLCFTPRELLLRMCALVPPPRVHTTRYGAWRGETDLIRRYGPLRGSDAPGTGKSVAAMFVPLPTYSTRVLSRESW